MSQLRHKLSQPEDAAALEIFRIGFGFITCMSMARYAWFFPLETQYLQSGFLFKYYGFEWVGMLPGNGLYWHLSILAVLAFMVTVGLFYRVASILFALGIAWFFLLDRAHYLNHYYMVVLFSFLLAVVPAGRMWSLDVRLRGVPQQRFAPRWARWLLLLQLEIILIYAGVVKINPDWINLAPLEQWLADVDGLYLMSDLFEQRWAIMIAAYGVIALHLVGAPLLLFKKTRVAVLCCYAGFHILNHFVFVIGIFPWMTLFASLLCLEPDWPRRVWHWLTARSKPYLGTSPGASVTPSLVGVPTLAFMVAWLTVQVLLPLRHYTYDGDVAWNDDGHLFSWRMKLTSQRGKLIFMVRDPATGERWGVDPRDHLSLFKMRRLSCRPDMILQFAHHLERKWQAEHGVVGPEVFAQNQCSLNFRYPAPQIDPYVDLTTIERGSSMASWVLPLTEELPDPIFAWSRTGRGE